MMHFAVLAFGIILSLAVFVWLCLPGSGRRTIATAAFTALAIGAFAAGLESAGQPRPIQLEWRNVLDAPIVGLTWNEELRRVYVWAMQGDEPVAYVLPWPADRQKFGQLQDRWRRRGVTGEEFLVGEGDIARVVAPKPMPEKTP